MVTIKEIAEIAGVSRGTVDRVLNNRSGVSLDTEKRVRDIAKKLQYEPNLAGKMLVAGKKKIQLGFIIYDTPVALFFRDVYNAAQKKKMELEPFGVVIKFYQIQELTEAHLYKILQQVEKDNLDGIAIAPLRFSSIIDFIKRMEQKKIPMIFYNVDYEECDRLCYIGSDYSKSGQVAAGLMALCTEEKGKIGIATIMDDYSPSFYERIESFKNEMTVKYPKMQIINNNTNYIFQENDYSPILNLIKQNPDIDAFYIVNPGDCTICEKVKTVSNRKTVRIITNDLLNEQRIMIKNGIIDATIGQQPEIQGSLPLQILYDYIVLGKTIEKDKIYTDLSIYISQNL